MKKPTTKKIRRHKPLRKWIRKTKQKGGFLITGLAALISSIIGGVSAAAAIPGVAAGVGALATGAAGAIGANLANRAMGGKGLRRRRVIYRRRR